MVWLASSAGLDGCLKKLWLEQQCGLKKSVCLGMSTNYQNRTVYKNRITSINVNSLSFSVLQRACAACCALACCAGFAAAITVTPNIPYVSEGGSNTVLDVILPDQPPRPGTPTVIMIHGGGWTTGDKSQVAEFCAELARLGYPVVNINYTLATPGVPSHPQAVKDVKSVIRWIRSSESLPFRLPPQIVVTGSSAGGHLALMAGMTRRSALLDPRPLGQNVSYALQGCVSMWGPADLIWDVETFGQGAGMTSYIGAPLSASSEGQYVSASPIVYVNPCDPPSAFFHGTADTVVPVGHSVRMAEALRSIGIYAETNYAPRGGHGFVAFGGQIETARLVAVSIRELRESRNPADFNRDGGVDGSDVQAFFDAWEVAEPDADVNGDGAVDGSDVEDFFVTWQAGGCIG